MQCVFVIEQPSTSILYRHPRFQDLCRLLPIFRAAFWMRKYGSPSPKRTVLWGNSKGVKRFRTDKLTKTDLERLPVRLARKSGDGRGYTGNKTALKQSQHLACKGFFKSCTAPDAHAAFQHVSKELPFWIWGQGCQDFQEAAGCNHHPSLSKGHDPKDLHELWTQTPKPGLAPGSRPAGACRDPSGHA